MCENCTRRDFLCATSSGALLLGGATLGDGATPPPPRPEKVNIAVLFAGNPVPADRSWGVCDKEISGMEKKLKRIEDRLRNVRFVVGRARNPSEARAVLQKAGSEAPVIAVPLCIGGLLRVSRFLLESGRPLAVFAPPASGHDWMYPYRWRSQGKAVTLFPSSSYEELERAARLLRVIPLLKHTRALVFEPLRGTAPARSPQKIKERLGAELVVIPQSRFDKLMEKIAPKDVEAEAERWIKGAARIIEPKREDVLKAARVSLALQRLVEEENAQGLAVGTCMGWLSRGFPCLGFTRLRDRLIPASCEGDMDSLLTMLIFGYAFDIPGFQGNNTFDTAKNACWTAHCVGPLKMDGPNGPEAPYLLRSHSEIGAGVVPEIQYRIGQKITRTKLINLDTLLISTGTIIEVPRKSFRACRTQIVTGVRNASAMARNWGGGVLEGDMMTLLHRVVFYGDHLESARHLCDLLNWRFVEEG